MATTVPARTRLAGVRGGSGFFICRGERSRLPNWRWVARLPSRSDVSRVFERRSTAEQASLAQPCHPPVIVVQWTSDDATVTTVSDAGEAMAVGDGEAAITAEADGLTGSAVLTVSAMITNVARISALDQPDLDGANDTATAELTVNVQN